MGFCKSYKQKLSSCGIPGFRVPVALHRGWACRGTLMLRYVHVGIVRDGQVSTIGSYAHLHASGSAESI